MPERIELTNGQWAEIDKAPFTGADLRAQREAAVKRGWDDPTMDGIVIALRRVKAWSFGDVTDDVFDAIPLADIDTLINRINDTQADPNGSRPSLNGARRTKAKEEIPPGNGS